MKNKHIFRNAFIKQFAENDCGIACLEMMFSLAGMNGKTKDLRGQIAIDKSGLSLIQLRDFARANNISARCVMMDMENLRNAKQPCILHVSNDQGDHYEVCLGVRTRKNGIHYLMADPAKNIYFITEDELALKWQSKAALYFDHFKIKRPSLKDRPWFIFLSGLAYPRVLWVAIPLLNIFTAILGVAISWVLQRWSNLTGSLPRIELIISVITLLLVITLFKNLTSFIKQRLIHIGGETINERLMTLFARDLFYSTGNRKRSMSYESVQNIIAEIQKIQNANILFISIMLGEGSIILMLIAVVYYLLPLAGYLNLCLVIITCFLTIRRLPELSFNFSSVKQSFLVTENLLLSELTPPCLDNANENAGLRFSVYQKSYKNYLDMVKKITLKTGRGNLLVECLGTMNTILVLGLSMLKVEKGDMNYNSVLLIVISSYLVSAVMPKICDAIFFVNEGAKSTSQFTRTISFSK